MVVGGGTLHENHRVHSGAVGFLFWSRADIKPCIPYGGSRLQRLKDPNAGKANIVGLTARIAVPGAPCMRAVWPQYSMEYNRGLVIYSTNIWGIGVTRPFTRATRVPSQRHYIVVCKVICRSHRKQAAVACISLTSDAPSSGYRACGNTPGCVCPGCTWGYSEGRCQPQYSQRL